LRTPLHYTTETDLHRLKKRVQAIYLMNGIS
jgi:hypothetical protein